MDPCDHPGCLNHRSHPCEGCGRIAGKEVPDMHPVQQLPRNFKGVPKEVALMAYEVYCHLYGPQPAMVTGWCRGGFGACEMIAMLYARQFPKSEWRERVHEVFL